MSTIGNQPYKWLLLPIESKVRELHGKLLLSAVAAERGWGVILGHKSRISDDTVRSEAVVIELNVSYGYRKNIDSHLHAGRHVCAWCEEGLVYRSGSAYCEQKVDGETLRKLDRFFLWGDVQRQDVGSCFPDVKDKFALTGNPRFDLLRPDLRDFYKLDVELLRRRYGRYILINTNFGRANHYYGKDWVLPDLKRKGVIRTKEQEIEQTLWLDYQDSIFKYFSDMVARVSPAFSEHTVIIRPHPSESQDTWRTITQNLRNVQVVHEGDVTPWLLGADAVIHNSCTTGVQSFLLDKPVIAYMPIQSDRFDSYLPNALSAGAQSIDELLQILSHSIRESGSVQQEQESHKLQIAVDYITGISGPLASEQIMDSLEQIDVKPQLLKLKDLNDRNVIAKSQPKTTSLLKRKLKSIMRSGFRTNTPDPKVQRATTTGSYVQQKFPGLTLGEVEGVLSRLQETTRRFHGIKAHQIHKDLICVLPGK